MEQFPSIRSLPSRLIGRLSMLKSSHKYGAPTDMDGGWVVQEVGRSPLTVPTDTNPETILEKVDEFRVARARFHEVITRSGNQVSPDDVQL